jgi:hypothetical protein
VSPVSDDNVDHRPDAGGLNVNCSRDGNTSALLYYPASFDRHQKRLPARFVVVIITAGTSRVSHAGRHRGSRALLYCLKLVADSCYRDCASVSGVLVLSTVVA